MESLWNNEVFWIIISILSTFALIGIFALRTLKKVPDNVANGLTEIVEDVHEYSDMKIEEIKEKKRGRPKKEATNEETK